MVKKKVTLSLDPKEYTKFKKYCVDHDMNFSKKIDRLIREFLKSKKLAFVISLFLVVFLLQGISGAGMILQPDGTDGKDTYIQQDDPTMVRGTSNNLDLALHWQNSAKRAILEFNLSSIPADQNIDNAVLMLYMYNDGPGADVNITAHRITRSWVEGTRGYTDNGATWRKYDGTSDWNTYGGDYDSGVEALTTTNTQNQWYEWNITDLVSDWYDGTYTNYGVLLKGEDETGDANRRKRFRASDYGTATQRPKLIINYSAGDDGAPKIDFATGTEPNDTSFSRDWIFVNVSASDENNDTLGFFLYNASGLVDSQYVSYATQSYNFTGLSDGTYSYNVTANDTLGNTNQTQTRTIHLDSTAPIVSYSAGTENNGAAVSRDFVYVNASVSEDNFDTIVFRLYNSSGLVSAQHFSDATRAYNFTGLSDGDYSYNVTANDTFGNAGDATTRTISLDTLSPVVDFSTGTENNYANKSQDFVFVNVSVTEDNEDRVVFYLYNASGFVDSVVFNDGTHEHTFTSLSDGTYVYNVSVNDSSGNSNSTLTRTITLDTTSPSVTFGLGVVSDGSYVSQNFVFVNVSAIESNEKNITFRLYNASGLYDEQTFVDGTRAYNFTGLSDGNYSYNVSVFDYATNINTTSTRSVILDTALPAITLVSPIATNYTNNSILVNVSATDAHLDSVWFYNGTDNLSYSEGYYTFGEGNNELIVYANDSAGNVNSTNVSFYVDTTAPTISLLYPESKTYGYDLGLPLNYSVADPSGVDFCWYNLDGGVNVSLPACANTTFDAPEGAHVLYLFSNDSFGHLGSSQQSFSVSTTLAVSLEDPTSGIWLSNNSVVFNYTVDTATDIYNCYLYGTWNGGWHANQTNATTVNTSGGANLFSVEIEDGDYVWNVHCQGFYSSFAFSNFSLHVDTTTPVVTMMYPQENETYTRNVSMNFSFAIVEQNLDDCVYTFDYGITNESISCDEEYNELLLDRAAGNYNVTLYAFDISGNVGSSSVYNVTINEDSEAPSLIIFEPTGARTSKSDIPLLFSVNDNSDDISELTCFYNVTYASTQGAVSGLEQVALSNCENTTFSVLGDEEYVVTLHVEDLSSHTNVTSSSFSVSTPQSEPGPTGSSGGGGGGSGGGFIFDAKPNLSVGDLEDISVTSAGIKKILSWDVKNSGNVYLNDCTFESFGTNADWIGYSENKGLAAGEEYTFIFDVTIPQDSASGAYDLFVRLVCEETSAESSFSVEIVETSLGFSFITIEREGEISVRVDYTLEELSGENQDVEIEFLLFDSDKKEITKVSETVFVGAGALSEHTTYLSIPEELRGELGLLVNINSQTYSGFVQENVVLGSPISGFTIFDRLGNSDNYVSIFLVVLFLGFMFFIIRKIRSHRSVAREKTTKRIHAHRGHTKKRRVETSIIKDIQKAGKVSATQAKAEAALSKKFSKE